MSDADAIVVGAGLAGLVAACELTDAGKKVIVVDQEPEQALGGQAFWSFGGLLLVDSPEQRRMRIRDSYELAWSDWLGTAAFDRPEDFWPRKWAEAYVAFAAGEIDTERHVEARSDKGEVFATPTGIFLTQVFHHGNLHRGHVGTQFGVLGIAAPDFSAWEYALATGRSTLDRIEPVPPRP